MSKGLTPSITKPTGITHSTATLIDNIYLSHNLSTWYSSSILKTEISDHLACLTTITRIKVFRKQKETIEYRNITENKDKIRDALGLINWDIIQNFNVDQAYAHLLNKTTEIIDFYAPLKRVSSGDVLLDPWITKDIITSIKKCQRKYRKVSGKAKTTPEYIAYTKYRNCLNRLKMKSRQKYYNDLTFKFRKNSKQLWGVIKHAIAKSTRQTRSYNKN